MYNDQHHCPNIQAGMELNEAVFHRMLAYEHARIASSIAPLLLEGRFGILMSPDGNVGLSIQYQEEGSTLVRVEYCYALSPAGNYLCVLPEDKKQAEISLDELDTKKQYRLTINGAFTPGLSYGPVTSPDDLPRRNRFMRPAYKLELVEKEVSLKRPKQSDSLDLTEFCHENGHWVKTDFLPASAQIGAIPDWKTYHQSVATCMEELIQDWAEIAHRASSQQSRGEQLLHMLCTQAGQSLSNFYYEYKGLSDYDTPKKIVEPWSALAGVLRFVFNVASHAPNMGLFRLIRNNTVHAAGLNGYDQNHLLEIAESLSVFNEERINWRESMEVLLGFTKDIAALFKVLKRYTYVDEDVVYKVQPPAMPRSKNTFDGQF